MTKPNVKKTMVFAIVASLFVSISAPSATAVQEPRILLGLDSVNEIALTTTFHFQSGDEIVDTFKVYRPLSVPTGTKLATSVGTTSTSNTGFDTRLSTPRFILEKIVGDETLQLYNVVDQTHLFGAGNVRGGTSGISEFDVDVTFQRGATPVRILHYSGCTVSDYYPYTEFDAEETYGAKTKFAYIDSFTFECKGLSYANPIYDQIIKDANTFKPLAKQ